MLHQLQHLQLLSSLSVDHLLKGAADTKLFPPTALGLTTPLGWSGGSLTGGGVKSHKGMDGEGEDDGRVFLPQCSAVHVTEEKLVE